MRLAVIVCARERQLYLQKKINNNNDLVLPGDWEPFQESGPNQHLPRVILFLALVKEKKRN